MFNFSKLITAGYWFDSGTGEFNYVIPITVLFLLFILGAFITKKIIRAKLKNKVVKKFLKDIPTALYIFGFTGLIFTFLRYEEVRYLSMRFWFLLLFIAFVLWLGFHIFQFRVLYPQVECEYKNLEDIDKYRPTPKHKKGNKNKR